MYIGRLWSLFTFSNSVVDDVVINVKSLCPKDTDGRREAVVEGTTLDVWLISCNLSTQKMFLFFQIIHCFYSEKQQTPLVLWTSGDETKTELPSPAKEILIKSFILKYSANCPITRKQKLPFKFLEATNKCHNSSNLTSISSDFEGPALWKAVFSVKLQYFSQKGILVPNLRIVHLWTAGPWSGCNMHNYTRYWKVSTEIKSFVETMVWLQILKQNISKNIEEM